MQQLLSCPWLLLTRCYSHKGSSMPLAKYFTDDGVGVQLSGHQSESADKAMILTSGSGSLDMSARTGRRLLRTNPDASPRDATCKRTWFYASALMCKKSHV